MFYCLLQKYKQWIKVSLVRNVKEKGDWGSV